MGKKSKAPEYATTTTDTGLWGSSTTGKSGTTYNAPDWMNSTMGTITSNLQPTINSMTSNDFENDANFQAYQNKLYNTMGQQYDQMLGNLADRGLMRSTGLQALNNNYAQALQDNVTGLYDSYYNRQANNLSNLLNAKNTLFNQMTGVTGLSQANSNAVSNHELEAYKTQQEANAAKFGAIAQAVGQIGGGLVGGPIGAAVGGAAGNLIGNAVKK
jgi:hypothetical protein